MSPHPLTARPGTWQRMGMIVVMLGGLLLVAWTSLGRWEMPSMAARQLDYYNLLVSGFQKGSLALDIEVPAELKQAKDPLQLLAQSPDIAPHDVSYFKGHFYTYYGVVPAVVLFWPYRVLTGHELPEVFGLMAFALGAFAVIGRLWLEIVDDHFPRAGAATRIAGVAALCLAGGQLVLARRVSIWEPSIEAGSFFLACMLFCGYRALRAPGPWRWLAACGLTLGLATGSRPTLVVAGFGLVPLIAAIARRDSPAAAGSQGRRLFKGMFASGIPLAAIGIGLLAYNWARFGNPLELGLNYQISTWNMVKQSHFRTSYIPFNLFLYFLAPPQWGRYFPFVHPISHPGTPPGYYGYEYVYGALVVCPVLWWTCCLLPYFRRADHLLRSFVALVFASVSATMLVLLCFDTAAARYETDFLPYWILLALVGWALLEDRAKSSCAAPARGLLRCAFVASAAFSCAIAFFCSAELHEILQTSNPVAYRALSRGFNAPTALVERLSGYRGGAVELNMAFARRPLQSVEPLVVTGVEYQRDYAYVYYQSDDVVRFCYVHPGEPVASSADIAIKPGIPYPLRIECGSLFPPEGHAAYDGWQAGEIASLKHWVKIDFNGKTVLVESRGSNEASPGTVQIGVDSGIGFCGRRFAGTISDVRRTGWKRPMGDLSTPGDFDLRVALPSDASPLISPLLTMGSHGRADTVGLSVTKPGQFMITYESWGSGMWRSAPFDAPADRIVSLRVRLGPALLQRPETPAAVLGRSFVVWRDGVPIWWRRTVSPLAADAPVSVFTNGVGSTALEHEFRGKLISASREPLVAAWRNGPFSALEFELGGRGGGYEPLVTTGNPGHSDMLAIEWMASDMARLVYHHEGQDIRASPPFSWRASEHKSVRIEMPSFETLDEGAGAGKSRLRAFVDGVEAWDTSAPYFTAASATVSIGRNLPKRLFANAELTSTVIDVRQVPKG